MDMDVIKVLAELPTVAILIYLLIKTQSQNDKLLAGLIESERIHARYLVEIICSGKIIVDDLSKVRNNISPRLDEIPRNQD